MPTQKTRSETREALFDAALDQFTDLGFQATSHADIAAAAGIGRTTFYEYFSSTEDLLVELVRSRLPRLTAELVDGLEPGLGPIETLGELVARMVEFVATDHLGLILHTEVPRLSERAQRDISSAHGELSGAFVEVYRTGVAAGIFRSMPDRLAARLIYDVIMTAGREVMEADEPKQRVHEYADAAVRFLIGGLASS